MHRTTTAVYHGLVWLTLVEQGWVTMEVFTDHDGIRWAVLLKVEERSIRSTTTGHRRK